MNECAHSWQSDLSLPNDNACDLDEGHEKATSGGISFSFLGGPLSTVFSSERPGWRCSFWSSTSWCSSCFCFSWSTARGWKPRLWWGHFQGWVESLLLIIIDHVSCWRPFLQSNIIFIIDHCCSAMTILTIIRWEHLHGQRDQAMCWEVGARWDLPFPLELWNWSSWTMGSSFFLSMLSSYHSHNHCPLKILPIVVLSSHQHQGTEPPSLAQQSGLSTQSCQKTSTNDTKVREKLCDLSLYLWTFPPIQKRL